MTRADGRGADELRPIRIARGVQPFAEGSCMIEVGMTRVLCAASVEERVPEFLRGTGSGWVTAEYSMLPRSTVVRTPREVRSGRPSGRTQEIQRLIGRALRSVTDLTSLGERTITVDCDVVVADGGTRTASISGAYVALVEALRKVVAGGGLDRVPVAEEIAAVSVGIVESGMLLDLTYEEDSAASVDMNVAMTASGGLVEVQGTAEGDPFTREQLDALMDLAATGIGQICKLQREALGGS